MSTTPSAPVADDDTTTVPDATVTPSGTRARVGLLSTTAIVVLLLDQASKAVALNALTPGVRVPVLGDLLGWRLIFNPGAAFSFGTSVTWVFTLVMSAVSVAVLLGARRVVSAPWAVALGAILGGAMGNLVDRLAREPGFGVGHVVDFIDYGIFIGNVADIAIVGAAIGMVLLSLLGSSWDGTRARAPRAAGDPATSAGAEVSGGAGRDERDGVAEAAEPADPSEGGETREAESADGDPREP